MTDRVIHVLDTRVSSLAPERPRTIVPATGRIEDTRGRPLRDLRISVTDRCNFRCTYCMPKEVFDQDYHFLRARRPPVVRGDHAAGAHLHRPRRREDPAHRRRAAAAQGHEKLIEMLAPLKTRDGRELDIALTTNGSLLARKARRSPTPG